MREERLTPQEQRRVGAALHFGKEQDLAACSTQPIQKPSTGRIVQYTLTEDDAKQINRRRTTGSAIAERIKNNGAEIGATTNFPDQWPIGAQAHIGNTAYAGDIVPLLIVRVWPDEYGPGQPGVNGQAFLDGNDSLWITSAGESPEPKQGKWNWPPRN